MEKIHIVFGMLQQLEVFMLTPIQLTALEAFLSHHYFEYAGYNHEAGTVIYLSTVSNLRIRIEFGDGCYYHITNDMTNEVIRSEFTQLREVMSAYRQAQNCNEEVD